MASCLWGKGDQVKYSLTYTACAAVDHSSFLLSRSIEDFILDILCKIQCHTIARFLSVCFFPFFLLIIFGRSTEVVYAFYLMFSCCSYGGVFILWWLFFFLSSNAASRISRGFSAISSLCCTCLSKKHRGMHVLLYTNMLNWKITYTSRLCYKTGVLWIWLCVYALDSDSCFSYCGYEGLVQKESKN